MPRLAASARLSATNRFTIRDQSKTLIFDGINGRVDLDGNLSFERTQPFTIAFWANVGTLTTNQEFIGKRLNSGTFRGWSVNMSSPGIVQVILRTGNTNAVHVVTGTRVVTANTWNHYLVTYDGSSLAAGVKVYINGTEQTLSVTDDDLNDTMITTGIASMGARNGGTDLFLNGSMTDVRIFTSVLTTQQISDGYLKNSWPTAYAYYPMTDQSGTTLTDFGTAGVNGILESGVSWGQNGPFKTRSSAAGRSSI